MKQKDGRHRTASAQAIIREQAIDYLKRAGGVTRSGCRNIWFAYSRSVNRMCWSQTTSQLKLCPPIVSPIK